MTNYTLHLFLVGYVFAISFSNKKNVLYWFCWIEFYKEIYIHVVNNSIAASTHKIHKINVIQTANANAEFTLKAVFICWQK